MKSPTNTIAPTRWVQHRYCVAARLRIAQAPVDCPIHTVQTCDTNTSGIRFVASQVLPDGASARLSLIAPDGNPLNVDGTIVVVQTIGQRCEAILIFETEQPRLA